MGGGGSYSFSVLFMPELLSLRSPLIAVMNDFVVKELCVLVRDSLLFRKPVTTDKGLTTKHLNAMSIARKFPPAYRTKANAEITRSKLDNLGKGHLLITCRVYSDIHGLPLSRLEQTGSKTGWLYCLF